MLALDVDGDGAITWGELKARHAAIAAYVQDRLAITAGEVRCRLEPTRHLVDSRADGSYAVVRFALDCPEHGAPLVLRYGVLFDIDPTHRGLLTVSDRGEIRTAVLAPDHDPVVLGTKSPAAAGPAQFFALGLRHLVYGLDHLLFLLVLLLPLAYRGRPEDAGLQRAGSWAEAIATLKILSAFTAAHGLSLAAVALGLVDLPARLVEVAIALTIMLTALDNLRPYLPRRRWAIAFGFGLIHGLGFASAFSPMGLPPVEFTIALLSFNLGIEAAQVAVALCFLAATFPLRASGRYGPVLVPAGSTAALAVASVWLLARALPFSLAAF